MIKIDITPTDQEMAIALSDHQVYEKSMRGKEANLVGAYGEIVVYNYLTSIGLDPVFAHTTTHDIEVDGYTFDVKTKERTVAPRPFYDCTVPAYNHAHQKPDVFIFVSLLAKQKTGNKRFEKAWILGMLSYDELTNNAKYWKKGEVDPRNNWKATIDCHNVQINQLKSLA